MPEFVCSKCHKKLSYGIGDSRSIRERLPDSKLVLPFVMTNTMSFSQWVYNQTNGECENCFSRIALDRYPMNIKEPGKKVCTVFSDMGKSVGDLCMNQVIRDEYVRRNPDEDVIFLDGMVSLDEIRQYNPLKVFWANLFTGGQEWVPRDAFWFAVTNEAGEFARQGHYARLPKQWTLQDRDDARLKVIKSNSRYVVVHLRNQIGKPDKSEAKNIKPAFAYAILKLLQNRYKAGMFDMVVLVGNDSDANGFDLATIESIIDDSLPLLDLRNRWEGDWGLALVAEICKNALVTIGSDSGIVQLAGAAGCPKIVSWDYANEGWFPKVKPGVLSTWVGKESRLDVVLEKVKEVISLK